MGSTCTRSNPITHVCRHPRARLPLALWTRGNLAWGLQKVPRGHDCSSGRARRAHCQQWGHDCSSRAATLLKEGTSGCQQWRRGQAAYRIASLGHENALNALRSHTTLAPRARERKHLCIVMLLCPSMPGQTQACAAPLVDLLLTALHRGCRADNAVCGVAGRARNTAGTTAQTSHMQ